MRCIAIDLGDRRTGLAVGDPATGIVTPLDVVEVRVGEALLDALVERIERHDPQVVVIGLPINMDGTEGERARLVRSFAARIDQRVDVPVRFQDERLSSFAADLAMARSGRTHKQKKRRRDALAAAAILQDYFDAPPAEPAP